MSDRDGAPETGRDRPAAADCDESPASERDGPPATDRDGPPADASDHSDRWIDRRALIRAGAVGVATAIAGCSGGDSGDDGDEEDPDAPTDGDADGTDGDPDEPAADVPHADEYGTVVDLVADGGADPTGNSSILPVLDTYAGDDTLLYFPEGEYLMDDIWMLREFEHLGVVGENATIVPQKGYLGYLFIFGLPDEPASDLLFEGVDFDFTAEETAPRPLQAQIDDGLTVRDVSVSGIGGTARFDITTPEGSGIVERLEQPDGGREPNPVGILVGPANEGHLRFQDCHVEGFEGNGLYASPSNGPIEVVGGLYANNGIASVRVSSPATVRDVTVRCDEAPEGFRNMRGIRLRHGESVTVENCTIEMSDLTYSDGALVIEPMMESATIEDVDIDVSVDDTPAVNVRTPEHDAGSTSLSCDRVSITGSASQGSAVRIVDRDECTLADLDIQQSGSERNGVHFIRSADSVLRNSEIDVPGESIVLEESNVRRVNTKL